MLASTTRALFDTAILLPFGLANLFNLSHQLLFGLPPDLNDGIHIFGCGAHRVEIGLMVSLSRRNEIAQHGTVPGDGERASTFEVPRQFLSKLADTNFFSFQFAYLVYTIARLPVVLTSQRSARTLMTNQQSGKGSPMAPQ